MDEASVRLAQTIRSLRKSKGLSQEKLAFLANLHRVYIGQIERCEKSPTLSTLKKLQTVWVYPSKTFFNKVPLLLLVFSLKVWTG